MAYILYWTWLKRKHGQTEKLPKRNEPECNTVRSKRGQETHINIIQNERRSCNIREEGKCGPMGLGESFTENVSVLVKDMNPKVCEAHVCSM